MIYVQRNDEGRIVAIYAGIQKGYAEECKSDDDPEIVEFIENLGKRAES